MTINKAVLIFRTEGETKPPVVVSVVQIPDDIKTQQEEFDFAMEVMNYEIEKLKRKTRDWYTFNWRYEIHDLHQPQKMKPDIPCELMLL